MDPERYPYSKRAFLPNLVLLAALLATASVLVLITPVDLFLGAAVLAVLVLALLVLGVSPYLTAHELSDDTLVLRQGWYFRAEIPRGNIKAAQVQERGPRKVGISFRMASPVVQVTTRRRGVIELELRRPQAFRWALGKRADRVVFDALDPDRLLARLR